MTPSISLFADVQNIYYTCRQEFGRHFNYRALWDELTRGCELHSAVAYAIDRGDAGQMNFQRILKDIGFHVRLKPYIQRRDGSAKGEPGRWYYHRPAGCSTVVRYHRAVIR